uniref:Uncharacterized protein n=1 Tax=Arundo donax TaxID=35708 RepID=A0A0A8YJE5_ARUDO
MLFCKLELKYVEMHGNFSLYLISMVRLTLVCINLLMYNE